MQPVCLSIDLMHFTSFTPDDIEVVVFVTFGAYSNHILPPAIFN